MAIDTSKIENYENMTAEEKVAALEAYEVPAAQPVESNDLAKLKTALSKANGEAAEYKRLLRERQTEAERAEAERAEADKALREELERYKSQERLSGYANKLMASGYDAEIATSMAASLPEGIPDEFFAQQKAVLDNIKKTYESAAMAKQMELTSGKPLGAKNIDDPELSAFRRAAGI